MFIFHISSPLTSLIQHGFLQPLPVSKLVSTVYQTLLTSLCLGSRGKTFPGSGFGPGNSVCIHRGTKIFCSFFAPWGGWTNILSMLASLFWEIVIWRDDYRKYARWLQAFWRSLQRALVPKYSAMLSKNKWVQSPSWHILVWWKNNFLTIASVLPWISCL